MAEESGGIDELRYMQQIYQNQYGALNNTINLRLRELQDLSAAQKTIESQGEVEERQSMMHVGASVYIKSRIGSMDKILVNVGANYLVEKEIGPAKLYLSELIKRENELLNGLLKNRKELEEAIIDLSYRIGRMQG